MPNFGQKSGGGFKPSSANKGGGAKSANKGAARKMAIQKSAAQRGGRLSRNKHGFQDDDMALDPEVAAEEEDTPVSSVGLEPAEPFSDGIVSPQFKGLVVIPRVGGEECSVLADFLLVFSRTEPFIGAISQKTSYMKKQGGRLL